MTSINFVKAQYPAHEREHAQSYTFHDSLPTDYAACRNTGAAATEARAPFPARALEGMSAMIFLRRSWKILRLTTSIRLPNHHVNDFWDTKATIANLRASNSRRERHPTLVEMIASGNLR
jgi:hypothetical protein